jgi:Fe-S cluster biosynthesis and repair protein YggX
MMIGMSDVLCRRCGQRKMGLAEPPLPGRWGPVVLSETCADCWHEWIEEQTRLINHERLLPSEPEHRKVLYTRMATFLNLDDAR